MDFTLCIQFSEDGENGKELLYDELKLFTSLDVEVLKDIAFPHIVTLKLDIDKKFAKSKPTRTSLSLDERDYRKFLSTFALSLMEVKTLLNDVVMIDGISFPYSVDEIYTTVDFLDKSMHIFMEVEDSAAEFFEKEWWDDKEYADQQKKSRAERAAARAEDRAARSSVDGGEMDDDEDRDDREDLAEEAADDEERREEAREAGEKRDSKERFTHDDEDEVPGSAADERMKDEKAERTKK